MSKTVIIPGSFDPVTKGHESVVKRASNLFDTVYVALMLNSQKKYLFTKEERLYFCQKAFEELPNVKVVAYNGLLASLYGEVGAVSLVKGVRSSVDYAYETDLFFINKNIGGDIETIFIPSEAKYQHISSSMIREYLVYGLDPKDIIPDKTAEEVLEKYRLKNINNGGER